MPNRIWVGARLLSTASASSSSFPFPSHPRPTPHEIFHLSYSASQQDIKARYYELVRAYHPDSPSCRLLPPSECHRRFQAITAAYDSLRRGRSTVGVGSHVFDEYAEEIARRKHMYYKHQFRRQQSEARAKAEGSTFYAGPGASAEEPHVHDKLKDQLFLLFGILSVCVGIAPGLFLYPVHRKRHEDAVLNLSQAQSEAREVGEQRRIGMSNKARDIRLASAMNSESHPKSASAEPD
ncbi:hypothetical protein K435DRAFT_781561 [Dendrothele bispora CBS 962.96]|uniref:J domain-containing protein n=1 Tax=Dendrothele bispora (strain CBS 962.96) TaxID=1314807 RepID=A0A4V4HE59_DENBC|nr:hypothetical protein K435DRAFT_781561 [Dendrothele bispora CBS 962.96]